MELKMLKTIHRASRHVALLAMSVKTEKWARSKPGKGMNFGKK